MNSRLAFDWDRYLKLSVLLPLCLVLIALRYAFLGYSATDYGWDIETAYVVSLGGRYGETFFYGAGPLSFQLLAKFLDWVGYYYVNVNALAYATWLALWGVYRCLALLQTSKEVRRVAIMSASRTIPDFLQFHFYNFLALCLSSWGLYFFLRFLDSGGRFFILLSALLSVLCFYSKQNFGLALMAFELTSLFVIRAGFSKHFKAVGMRETVFFITAQAGFLAAGVFYYGHRIGIVEFIRLLFDASGSRGGAVSVLLRILPLARLNVAGSDVAAYAIGTAVALVFTVFFVRLALSKSSRLPPEKSSRQSIYSLPFLVFVVVALTTGLAVPVVVRSIAKLAHASDMLSFAVFLVPAFALVPLEGPWPFYCRKKTFPADRDGSCSFGSHSFSGLYQKPRIDFVIWRRCFFFLSRSPPRFS